MPIDEAYETTSRSAWWPGWEWEGPWSVETSGHVDRDGWAYGMGWGGDLPYPPPPAAAQRRMVDLVRRRRWIRHQRCMQVQSPASNFPMG